MNEPHDTPAHERPTVLVVDDTPENIAVLHDLLRGRYRVRVANSGPRALKAAASEPRPDVILLDVMMPGMDGYEVLTRLRALPGCETIPVIFVTALDATDDEARGLSLGAADYLTKPVRPPIVLARVAAPIELKHARDRLHAQNAWLEREIARRTHEAERVRDATLRALASLAETRDNETGNHILRTQNYVALLCDELSKTPRDRDALDPVTIARFTKAAPLHDIGKVGIPDHILLKPGRLTPDELVIMRTHAALGAEAIGRAIEGEDDLAPFGFLQAAMLIARHHHERWDGTGYPDALRGEAIPLCARVMAVADVFDALLARRPYKRPMPFEAALTLVADGRGSHFDPAVVDAFFRRLDDVRAVATRYADHPTEPTP